MRLRSHLPRKPGEGSRREHRGRRDVSRQRSPFPFLLCLSSCSALYDMANQMRCQLRLSRCRLSCFLRKDERHPKRLLHRSQTVPPQWRRIRAQFLPIAEQASIWRTCCTRSGPGNQVGQPHRLCECSVLVFPWRTSLGFKHGSLGTLALLTPRRPVASVWDMPDHRTVARWVPHNHKTGTDVP